MKTIDIFGTKWTVKYYDGMLKEEDGSVNWGTCDSINHIITVSSKNLEGKPIPESELKLTLLHELVHAIFLTGQYIQSSGDEPLVEWTARCINSLIKQKVI